jgi:hypothetical protein
MASRATGILRTVEDRLPAPWARRFGTPAAAAWTGVFVLIAAFGIINWGVGLMLDAVLHPAPAVSVTEPAGEPASVMVDLPPPLTPRVAPAAAAPVLAVPSTASQRRARSDRRGDRHGWRSRRWRERAPAPAGPAATALPATHHSPSPTGLLIGGLPKRVAVGDAPMRKGADAPTPSPSTGGEKSAKPLAAPAAPAAAASRAGPPAAP